MKSLRKTLNLLTAGHFCVDTYSGFITPLMPFISAKLGISIVLASTILSLSHLASSIMQPVFGYISDLISKRFFVVWGLIIAAIFVSLIGVVPNVWSFAMVLILGSVGVAFYHPQASSLTVKYSGDKLNEYMGIFVACGTIGYAIGPVISSFIVNKFGLQNIIWAFPPGLILAFFMWKDLPKLEKINKENKITDVEAIFKAITGNKDVMILSMIAVVKSLIIITFCTYMPFFWQAQGVSVFKIGVFVGLFSFFGGISSYISGRIAGVFGKKNVFYSSLITMTIFGILCLYSTSKMPSMSFFLFVLTGFCTSFSGGINMSMAQQALPSHKGVVSGIIGGFSWGVIGLSLMPFGVLVSKFGIIQTLTVVSVIPILSAFFVKDISDELCAKN